MTLLFYIGRRIGLFVVVLLLVTFATSVMLTLIPGNPAYNLVGSSAPLDQIRALDKQYGFNQPVFAQYWHWLNGFLHGNLGISYQSKVPVSTSIRQGFPVTLELALLALVLALLVSVPLALWSAYRAGSVFDRVTDGVTSSFISLPAFVTALLLVFVFAIKVRVFPAIGWTPLTKSLGGNLRTAALPVISLSLAPIAVMQRVLRADIIATLQQDFIILARAKGLPTWKILLRHALRPSSFSLLTVAGLTLGTLLGGTVIIETVFSLPGLGQLLVTAILNKDLVAVQGTVAVIALGYVTVNLVIDLAYLVLDPRVRRA